MYTLESPSWWVFPDSQLMLGKQKQAGDVGPTNFLKPKMILGTGFLGRTRFLDCFSLALYVLLSTNQERQAL